MLPRFERPPETIDFPTPTPYVRRFRLHSYNHFGVTDQVLVNGPPDLISIRAAEQVKQLLEDFNLTPGKDYKIVRINNYDKMTCWTTCCCALYQFVEWIWADEKSSPSGGLRLVSIRGMDLGR